MDARMDEASNWRGLGGLLVTLCFDYDLLAYKPEPDQPRRSIPAITSARVKSEGCVELVINETPYVLIHQYTFFSSNDLVGGYIQLSRFDEILFVVQTEHSHEDSDEYWNEAKSVDVLVNGPWIDDFLLVYRQVQEIDNSKSHS